MKRWLTYGLLVFGLAALPYSCISPPLMITHFRAMPQADCVIMEWCTTVDAHCSISLCEDGLCRPVDLAEKWTTSHIYYAPLRGGVTIFAVGKDNGEKVHMEVRK